jgi:hypothetical protein
VSKTALATLAAAVAVLAAFAAVQIASGARASSVQVIATGLNNPRGVTLAPDGSIFVAEAGAAGKKCMGSGENQTCLGYTGAIDRFWTDGRRDRYGAGFVSGGSRDGSFSVGMDGVAVSPGGTVYGIETSEGDPSKLPPPLRAQAGYVLRVDANGKTPVGENVAAYEFENNPAHDNIDTDPYGIAWSPLGLAVTDAAGNSLLLLSPDGTLSCLQTFKAETYNGRAVQRVPTTVVWHDGAFYVGELGGGGSPNGTSHVWRVAPDGAKSMEATGFTAITGLAFGPDGSMYVSELASKGLEAAEKGQLGGAIVRVWPDGHRTTITNPQLIAPAGIAVAPDNTIYVVVGSVFAGKGKLLAITQ